MIEPTLNSSDQNSLGDLEQLLDNRREHREQAALCLYEALELITRAIRSDVRRPQLGGIALLIHDARLHLEQGGVAIPRLPTQEEMDR